jgi:PAS domain S-box-containing protein
LRRLPFATCPPYTAVAMSAANEPRVFEGVALMSMLVPILVVDDRPANVVALKAALPAEEHEIVVASSGAEAVRQVTQRDFAVVLIDVQMPEADAFETASQMKRLARHGRPVPILFVTGIDGDRSRILGAYAEGCVDVVQRPIEPEIVRAKVAVFAELYRLRRRLFAQRTKTDAAESDLSFAKAVIDNVPELAWTARPDGYVDFYNHRWFEFTGTSPEQMRGWGWKAVHHEDVVDAVAERWQRSLRTGQPFEMEFPLRRADGAFRWFLTRCVPVRGKGGAIVRWFGTSTDVNESHELREALASAARNEKGAHERADRLCEDALRAVRAREDLLAIVSHDLRNPLSTVLMSAHQLVSTADDGEAGQRTKKAAGRIVKAVERMNRLIGDLLDLATLEVGQPLPVELERVDVVELLREVAELFEPMAKARQLTLATDLAESIYIECDGSRVQQAVSNLLGNAIKFTREGGTIYVEAGRVEDEVLVTVRDTGIGIPNEHLPHIFKPYWHADAIRKRGTGLGLSIVKAIAETHGGRVWVESTPDEGSSFYLALPTVASLPPPRNRNE